MSAHAWARRKTSGWARCSRYGHAPTRSAACSRCGTPSPKGPTP